MKIATGVLRREGLRLFRRLREPGHFLRQMADSPEMAGLFTPRNKWQRAVMTLDMKIVEALHREDLLLCESRERGEAVVYVLSSAGDAWWCRETSGAEPFREQHQLPGQVAIEEPGRGMIRREANLGESPLGWLRRRRGKNGVAYLSEPEADAGEQLRRDYTFAQLGSRTTLNWDGMLAHVDSSGPGGADRADISAHVLDARQRVERALAFVGPGLAEVVVETCCHLKGLEQAERTLGWPQRSGKVVLKIALTRLAEHYKMLGGPERRTGIRIWTAPEKEPAGDRNFRDQSV
jgi:uncharacterized protein DUF6456